jgi:signal peptidase II
MTKIKTYPAFIIMGVVIFLDQLTKILIRTFIKEGEAITIWKSALGDFLEFCHLKNSGAAFSISLPNQSWNKAFFISTTILAIIFILWLLFQSTHRIQVVAFGMVLGGAIGNNLIDRPIFGAVTDFVSVNIPNIIHNMDRFPVFNVADSSIFIAMCLLIYDMIFIKDTKALSAEPESLPEQESDPVPTDINS